MDIPILAADWVGVIVGIIFLLVSAASAISNIAKEKNKGQPGKVKEKAALQKELEKFLQDAMNPQQKKKEKPAEIDFFDEDEVEIVPEPPVRQQPQRRQRKQRQTRSQQGQRAQKSAGASSQVTPEPKKPHLTHRERAAIRSQEQAKRMGGSVRDRLERKQQSHIQTRLTSHIESKVGEHFSETFGSRRKESRKSTSKTGGSKVIRSMLRNPQSFRQAIILNEILSPPKSRRRS
ncbi:hypothetical protein [Gimesia fumaroli]|jgi:hypothetical protein|uniref:Uncharacterized protein n=1 Tax=Gimesia fumaroli TaxID=2527976 RepID=A0A518IKA8_9PLAN|nr:hypothetical protein [Gimesia fumaroli]QDV53489.1 hypothetical protein Enr17x_55640 [Gimesia fumaroli]